MSGEREDYFKQLMSEAISPEPRKTVHTERVDGDGVKRTYIDLGTAQLGGDYHGMVLHSSPMAEGPVTSGTRARRRRLPKE